MKRKQTTDIANLFLFLCLRFFLSFLTFPFSFSSPFLFRFLSYILFFTLFHPCFYFSRLLSLTLRFFFLSSTLTSFCYFLPYISFFFYQYFPLPIFSFLLHFPSLSPCLYYLCFNLAPSFVSPFSIIFVTRPNLCRFILAARKCPGSVDEAERKGSNTKEESGPLLRF